MNYKKEKLLRHQANNQTYLGTFRWRTFIQYSIRSSYNLATSISYESKCDERKKQEQSLPPKKQVLELSLLSVKQEEDPELLSTPARSGVRCLQCMPGLAERE